MGSHNGLLSDGVKAGGGLVKYQYRCVLQDGPGYGHPLFLSSGQFEAPLPHLGLVAARPLHDGAVQLSQAGRRPHHSSWHSSLPYLMLCRMLSWNSTQSWGTMAICRLNVSMSRLEISNCPILMFPPDGSKNL